MLSVLRLRAPEKKRATTVQNEGNCVASARLAAGIRCVDSKVNQHPATVERLMIKNCHRFMVHLAFCLLPFARVQCVGVCMRVNE